MENDSTIEITHIIQLLVGYPPNIAMENPSYKPPFIYPCLVGGFNPSEKYESMGRIIPYIMEN
jgi:hypothetical protein